LIQNSLYNLLDLICNLLAPLTVEEVAAIDAAGANGPPVTLRSIKERLLFRRVWLFTSSLAFLALLGYYSGWVMVKHAFSA